MTGSMPQAEKAEQAVKRVIDGDRAQDAENPEKAEIAEVADFHVVHLLFV